MAKAGLNPCGVVQKDLQGTGGAAGARIDLNAPMLSPRTFLPALPVLLLACSSPVGQAPPTGERYGGIFNYNETKALRSIFPPQVTSVAEQRVASQIYEGLVGIDPKTLGIIPALAERWELDSADAVYTFHLRPDARFHDDPAFPDGVGRKVTAEDIVHCLTRICHKEDGDNAFWLLQGKVQGADEFHDGTSTTVSGLSAPDERTVRIKLTGAVPNFLYSLAGAGCWIWPKELTDTYGNEPKMHAIGTGPFKLAEMRDGEVIVLQRNPHYWGLDAEGRSLPYLDGIRITLVADKEREVAEFLRGHLCMVSELSLERIDLLTDSMDTTTGQRRFSVSSMPTLSVQYYGLNASVPPFNDLRVRRAFALAINKKVLVDSVLHGMAVEADHGLVPPGFNTYPYEMVQPIPFAPDSARALLAMAGFPGGAGFPRIQLQVNTGGFGYRETASYVQEALSRELGVWITITTVPEQAYYDRIESGAALMWREGWVADLPDPENFLALLNGQNAVADTALPSPLNTTRFADPRVDALIDHAAHEKNDVERNIDLASAENLAMRAVPLIPLYHERSVQLTLPYVMGLRANALELLDLRDTWFQRTPVQPEVPTAQS